LPLAGAPGTGVAAPPVPVGALLDWSGAPGCALLGDSDGVGCGGVVCANAKVAPHASKTAAAAALTIVINVSIS
jgi:hypothetical protein